MENLGYKPVNRYLPPRKKHITSEQNSKNNANLQKFSDLKSSNTNSKLDEFFSWLDQKLS